MAVYNAVLRQSPGSMNVSLQEHRWHRTLSLAVRAQENVPASIPLNAFLQNLSHNNHALRPTSCPTSILQMSRICLDGTRVSSDAWARWRVGTGTWHGCGRMTWLGCHAVFAANMQTAASVTPRGLVVVPLFIEHNDTCLAGASLLLYISTPSWAAAHFASSWEPSFLRTRSQSYYCSDVTLLHFL